MKIADKFQDRMSVHEYRKQYGAQQTEIVSSDWSNIGHSQHRINLSITLFRKQKKVKRAHVATLQKHSA